MFVSRVERNAVVVEDVADYVLTVAFLQKWMKQIKKLLFIMQQIHMDDRKKLQDYNISEKVLLSEDLIGLEAHRSYGEIS